MVFCCTRISETSQIAIGGKNPFNIKIFDLDSNRYV